MDYLTAEEELIIIGGIVVADMTQHPSTRLGLGGIHQMGSRMAPHQFSCQATADCLMFVTFNKPYDIRWG
jgi:hypothetical protein